MGLQAIGGLKIDKYWPRIRRMMRMMMRIKVASNHLKMGYVIVHGTCIHELGTSKLSTNILWVYESSEVWNMCNEKHYKASRTLLNN